MDEKIVKKTQTTLGKIISKPPLTDKLLSKPPFRYLHDIMMSVLKTTGFMKGLFTATEMDSQNVKDKEAKILFLQKAIDLVGLVVGRPLLVRPSKIVAGHEPERTNEFLQQLAEAVGLKVENDSYVRRALAGEKPGQKKELAEDLAKTKNEREGSKSKVEKDESERPNKESEGRKLDGKGRRDSGEGERQAKGDSQKGAGRRKEERKKVEAADDGEGKGGRKKERERRKEERRSKNERRRDSRDEEDKPSVGHADTAEAASDSEKRKKQARADQEGEDMESRQLPETSVSNGPVTADDLPPQVAKARQLQRPGSARPAAPRPKKNEAAPDDSYVHSGKVPNVIIDREAEKSEEDEEELFVAKEEDERPRDADAAAPEDDEGEEHGGLVKRILQTKKQLESNEPRKVTVERPHMSDAARRKEREMVQKEIEGLRSSIQSLTRSANPLGKTLDYLQEDLDSMQKEHERWRLEHEQNMERLRREQSVTQSALDPLYSQLAELDQQIRDQLDRIAAVKHNIARNDEKTIRMLASVGTT